MGSGRGRKAEDKAEARSEQAYQQYTPSPLEEKRNARTMKFLDDFEGGKDVKDIDAVRPYYDLFQNAKNSQKNQMIGRGVVALGRNGNADSQVSDLDKYVQAQREQDAAGMLYGATNQAYGDALGESQYLIGVDQQRKAGRAGLAANMYQTVLHRPERKPLWERLLGMGVGAGATIASAGMA